MIVYRINMYGMRLNARGILGKGVLMINSIIIARLFCSYKKEGALPLAHFPPDITFHAKETKLYGFEVSLTRGLHCKV